MAFEFEQIGETISDTGKGALNFVKKNKEIFLIGGGALILMLLLGRNNGEDSGEYVVAESVEGYPDVAENSETILDSLSDKYLNLSNQIDTHDRDMTGEFDNTNGLIEDIQSDNTLYVDKNNSFADSIENSIGGIVGTAGADTVQKKVVKESVLKTGTYYKNGETPQSAFENYYNDVTGGGKTIKKEYDDGSKEIVYRPNKPQGKDKNGDGGISVSYNRKGEVVSSELNESHAVHTYDGKVYDTTIGTDGKAKETKVYKSSKNLPTYTGIDKDKNPTQYTIVR